MSILVLKRAAIAALLVIAASVLTFALVAAAPGNVAALIAERMAGPNASAELIARIAADLGLNDPLPVRYLRWLGDAVRGDFGISLRSGKPLSVEFAERVPVTALLLFGGGLIAFALSLGLGIAGAISNGGPVDNVLRTISLVGASTPNFFVAAVLVITFAVTLNWLPSFGGSGPLSWILPWATSSVLPASILSRVVRVNLQDAMSRPYATTGFAKGLTRSGVILQEALPTIAVPFLTTFGAQFALMMVASMVVETVFALRGIGAFFIEVIRFRDFISMQAILLLFVVFFVVTNLVVDIVCMLIDPRIRKAAGA
ncbi:MAG: ABC transporter permease [Devosia sp.]|uniref:ABC transporter permease n=1 Tax=Devosia sp. 66-22 TaxID=1895753 RepID=UPI0009259F8A|nr:ABC transporter permease [Devosia sp. 66-22]MBN9348059.1 ABC transporter permease [Devosia sp.]OJX46533.1 MAG: nickel ABC transporter permease [Devosia sp. 66-22]